MILTVSFLLETLAGYPAPGDNPVISTVVIDSRLAEPGSLFVAFVGEKSDGHDYVADAFARGAQVALVERRVGDYPTIDSRRDEVVADLAMPFCLLVDSTLVALQRLAKSWRSLSQARVIGITGSVGKTTTKELVHAVLSQAFHTLKSEGSYNNEIGLPLTLLKLKPSHERAVLEMGTYGRGEIAGLCEIAQPHIGVVTIIGPVHLERMGQLETIVRAKQELVEALPATPDGVAILNKDDARVMSMADHTQARVFSYGVDSSADLWADDIESRGLEGIKFSLHYGRETLKNITVPLLGRHSVHTALRATAVGLVEGLDWGKIIAGLQGLTSQLRLVAVPGPKQSILIDDTYNSSPESAIAALNLLADLHGRRVAVLGDMLELGIVEEASHRLVGRRAKAVAHILVTVGSRGRLIGEEAVLAGMPANRVFMVEDADAAVAILKKIIEPNDMILVKGSRGAHLDHIVSTLGEG